MPSTRSAPGGPAALAALLLCGCASGHGTPTGAGQHDLSVPSSQSAGVAAGSDGAQDGSERGADAPAARAVPVSSRVEYVSGAVAAADKASTRKQLARMTDAWWEAAFLSGTYPRSSFPAAFPAFTRAAEERARKDKQLLSNADIGQKVSSVTATRKEVVVDLLGAGGRARGATVRFELEMSVEGEVSGPVLLSGRLLASRIGGQWRFFGYDVKKDTGALSEAEAPSEPSDSGEPR